MFFPTRTTTSHTSTHLGARASLGYGPIPPTSFNHAPSHVYLSSMQTHNTPISALTPSHKNYIPLDVQFRDHIFSYTTLTSQTAPPTPLLTPVNLPIHTTLPVTNTPDPPTHHVATMSAPPQEGLLCSGSSSGITPTSSPSPTHSIISSNPCVDDPPPVRCHPMVARSQNNIFKPKRALNVSKHPLPENLEPSNV